MKANAAVNNVHRVGANPAYSGAEYMVTDLLAGMEGAIHDITMMPSYLCPAAILVRPGNPRRVHEFPDDAKGWR